MPWLALMMFVAPALGVPHEEMLQDTLKSIVVSFGVLGTALVLVWHERGRTQPLRWHGVIWLPLLLMAWSLGSMAWSHTYLAGVEAVRWFVFALLVWVGLNTLTRERFPLLAAGIHAGAVVASLWAALQFWFDMRLFPQGPHPASTFVNRNFFAEFAVCTIPFGAFLLANARRAPWVALLAFSNALVVVAILMTGTRSALIALWSLALIVLPLLAWRCRDQLAASGWSRNLRIAAAGVLLATVALLGAIPSGDPKILAEERGSSALARGANRTQSIGPSDSSLGVRALMWLATIEVIKARPLSGVGAGAWESEIPLYQADGAQLETDYYAHNEFLQLLAEFGLAGWAFLILLGGWLGRCAWMMWRAVTPDAIAERPLQAAALASLFALAIVSNVGFPWRMAVTGALFALCLALLAGAEARLGAAPRWTVAALPWRPSLAKGVFAVVLACAGLAVYITQRAIQSEAKIVRATRMALTVSASGDPTNAQWIPFRRKMLATLREGIDLNRHYRKITPMVADELAGWGDWANAIWIWESVLDSRPHVVAMLCNVARGYASTGDPVRAQVYLERARQIQPRAPAVRSLEVILASRTDTKKALQLARDALEQGIVDFDLLNAAFVLGWREDDHDFALKAMNLRLRFFPERRAQGYVQLGTFYEVAMRDTPKALDAYGMGLAMANPGDRSVFASQIPAELHDALGLRPAALPPAQTSSSSR